MEGLSLFSTGGRLGMTQTAKANTLDPRHHSGVQIVQTDCLTKLLIQNDSNILI